MSIEVRNLVKIYGSQKAVNNISFTINKGEVVGFLGPNGAGKSTTIKIITGYLQPDEGEVHVCGLNVKEQPLEIKKKIGYLPEANPLYYDMYVREYLEFIAGVHKIEKPKEKIQHVIELTGLTTEHKKQVGQLSKGYKQRVGLAASLIHNPEVLILDEPTSGLDPNQIIEIRNVIKEEGRNKTILFSSHILQEVQAICDRVLIINKGGLITDDTLNNLKQNAEADKIKVRFKEPINAEWLRHLPLVKNVSDLGGNTWLVASNDSAEVRKQLFQLAIQHNLNIISLQNEESNLEEIFRSLTKTD
ncbi:MAG: gliding motility-associated ABC transporter ATP-binding subunit GldA [Parafilimonas sp.]